MWIETVGSNKFRYDNIIKSFISITDIAHSLASQQRYLGHGMNIDKHYSTAEHSIHVCNILACMGATKMEQKWGLMHDAAEAYIGDMPAPLKIYFRSLDVHEYDALEVRIRIVIAERLKLKPITIPIIVNKVDKSLAITAEKKYVMKSHLNWGKPSIDLMDTKIHFWTPRVAKDKFLSKFDQLWEL